MSSDLERAKEFFIKDRFAMVTTGIDILEVAPMYAKCSLQVDERHCNAVGLVMGGAIYTLADFTFAVATNFDQPAPTVTLTSSISYLSGMKGKILYAESRMVKNGKRNCFLEISVTDDLGTPIAIVNVTGAHL